jgi:PKHD-type hydroxylase
MPRFSVETLRAFVPALRQPYESAVVLAGVFSPSQCRRIVDAAGVLELDQGRIAVGAADAEADDDVRRARIAWIPADDDHGWIHDKLATAVERANRRYGFDLIGFTEDLQFTEYEGAGAFYDWHHDGLDGELAIRKLSLVVQLSDPADYEGGNLELFADAGFEDDERRRALRAQGTVVAFPSYEYHRVTPLTSGVRRSLVCWIGGPPFR